MSDFLPQFLQIGDSGSTGQDTPTLVDLFEFYPPVNMELSDFSSESAMDGMTWKDSLGYSLDIPNHSWTPTTMLDDTLGFLMNDSHSSAPSSGLASSSSVPSSGLDLSLSVPSSGFDSSSSAPSSGLASSSSPAFQEEPAPAPKQNPKKKTKGSRQQALQRIRQKKPKKVFDYEKDANTIEDPVEKKRVLKAKKSKSFREGVKMRIANKHCWCNGDPKVLELLHSFLKKQN